MKRNNNLIKLFVSIVVLLCLAFIPYIINHSYLSGYNDHIQPNTMFQASDLLNYWGTILSAISAGILGYIAFRLNQKVLALTEADTEGNRVSIVILESVDSNDVPWNLPASGYNSVYDQLSKAGFVPSSNIGFHIYNVGPAPLSKVVIHYTNSQNGDLVAVESLCSLAPHSKINAQIPMINHQEIRLNFEFISCFQKSLKATCLIAPAGIGVPSFETIVDYQIL